MKKSDEKMIKIDSLEKVDQLGTGSMGSRSGGDGSGGDGSGGDGSGGDGSGDVETAEDSKFGSIPLFLGGNYGTTTVNYSLNVKLLVPTDSSQPPAITSATLLVVINPHVESRESVDAEGNTIITKYIAESAGKTVTASYCSFTDRIETGEMRIDLTKSIIHEGETKITEQEGTLSFYFSCDFNVTLNPVNLEITNFMYHTF